VLGDHVALRRILANLVDNAVEYGEMAEVALVRSAGQAVLTVDDHGPGIPVEQRAAMLEPFTRLDQSRNRRTGGAGLGLAVCRSLVEAQGGAIAILDGPAGGRIQVTLPLVSAIQRG
jgi:signal transduction histidine kinase